MENKVEINDIQNPIFKQSAFDFKQMLVLKGSEFFKNEITEMSEHTSFLELVIPTTRQVMAEDLTQFLDDTLHLHIMSASKEDDGRVYKIVAYSTPVENAMYMIHFSSTMYGVVDSITVHFFDSTEVMYMYVRKYYHMIPSEPSCVLERQELKDILSIFI